MTRRRLSAPAREAVAVLAAHGHAADVDLDGKHLKICWVVDGRRHLLVISKSPSDRRAQIGSRVLLRRLLRQEGRP